jgi:hypothetical protein
MKEKKGIFSKLKKKSKVSDETEPIINKINKNKQMAEKGLLSKAMESKIAKWLDDQVKLDGIFELVDGIAFKLLISQLDNSFGEKIPEPYKTKIQEIIVIVFEEEDIEKAIGTALDFIDEMVDIPYLDDESEKLLFDGLLMVLLSILAKITPPKKEEE